MAQVMQRKRGLKVTKADFLLDEMKRRKGACLNKLQKVSDRINVLEQFKNEAKGKNIDLKTYLKSKGYNYRDFFVPMGYYTPKGLVVSEDVENKVLTYGDGMNFNKNVGYAIPNR